MLCDIESVLHVVKSERNFVVAHSMGSGLALALAAHPLRTTPPTKTGGGSGSGSSGGDDSKVLLAAAPPTKISAATAAGGSGANAGPEPVKIDRMLLLGSHPIHIATSGSALINYCCDCWYVRSYGHPPRPLLLPCSCAQVTSRCYLLCCQFESNETGNR